MSEQNNINSTPDSGGKNKTRFNIYWVYGIIALTFLFLQFFSFNNTTEEINVADFKNNMLLNGHVEKVIVVNKETVEVYIKPSEIGRGRYTDNSTQGWGKQIKPNFYFRIGSIEHFERQMAEAQQGVEEAEKVPVFL